MPETLGTYFNVYYFIPTLLFLILLGYLLRWWYQISYLAYSATVLLVAFFLGLGYLAVVKYGFSVYMVGGAYLLAIIIGYLAARWYHISWRDLMGKFSMPKTT
jgi:hypothetical protein